MKTHTITTTSDGPTISPSGCGLLFLGIDYHDVTLSIPDDLPSVQVRQINEFLADVSRHYANGWRITEEDLAG